MKQLAHDALNADASLVRDQLSGCRAAGMSASQVKALGALDRMTALWVNRVSVDGLDASNDGTPHHRKDGRVIECALGQRPEDPSQETARALFLGAALDRIERTLDQISELDARLQQSASACQALAEMHRWLDLMGWDTWPRGALFSAFARCSFLKMRIETHPAWAMAPLMVSGAQDREPVFSKIARSGGCDAADGNDPAIRNSAEGALLKKAFQESLAHGHTNHFREGGFWMCALFVGSLSGHAWSDGLADRAIPESRVAWLVGGGALGALNAVARMFYPEKKLDGANNGSMDHFLVDGIKPNVLSRLLALVDDDELAVAVANCPHLVDDEGVLARVQRAALQTAASRGGRKLASAL